ncbi:MAG: enoyl-CoA hydratase/isomerase family protein [Acidobacteria bacterium]|nr:enoyl-CoA hydratase/isomerase family protein [Acidobacteriota bacterium]
MVNTEIRHGGGHLRLVIDAPKANLVSIAVMRELRRALAGVLCAPAIKLVTIEGAGDHFSFGASVEDHRPGVIHAALTELHGLILELLSVPAPTAAVVRGRCLGGGFELALACDLVFAGSTAMLGVPEITLGVFPPAAAALLPLRVGASRAASSVLTGRTSPVDTWAAAGLIEVTVPPQELGAAVDHWFEAHLAPRSAAALRCAALASRATLRHQVDLVLPELERLYLDTLMRTHDAIEGIEAFLGKRAPVWSNA